MYVPLTYKYVSRVSDVYSYFWLYRYLIKTSDHMISYCVLKQRSDFVCFANLLVCALLYCIKCCHACQLVVFHGVVFVTVNKEYYVRVLPFVG